eukprot:SAG31_NODE_3095_length_4682_cov_2.946542_2_plen_93_part_00
MVLIPTYVRCTCGSPPGAVVSATCKVSTAALVVSSLPPTRTPAGAAAIRERPAGDLGTNGRSRAGRHPWPRGRGTQGMPVAAVSQELEGEPS